MEKVYVVRANSYTVMNYDICTDKKKAEEQAANFAPTSCEVDEQLRITPETRKLLEQVKSHLMYVIGYIEDALKCEGSQETLNIMECWDAEVDAIIYKLDKVSEATEQQIAQASWEESEEAVVL